jgi:hypothetical protein
MNRNKIISSELKVTFKNGSVYTYKKVLSYNPTNNWTKFEIVTKVKDKDNYVTVLDICEIKSIQETLKRTVRTSEK